MGRETLPEVRDRSGAPPGGSGRVGGRFLRSQMGRQALQKFRDGSRDPP